MPIPNVGEIWYNDFYAVADNLPSAGVPGGGGEMDHRIGGTEMKKRNRVLALLTAALLSLTGCFSQSAEDLYIPPKAPRDFENLDAKIREVISAGAEYAAPIQGSYTQQVQLMDLDGDGVQEAIAFFRVTNPGPDESPLKIYIYSQDGDGNFEVQTIIQGEGAAINSVTYVDLDGDPGNRELVVSWQISGKVYQLMAYAIQDGQAVDLMRVGYTEFAVIDLDMDNIQEVVVLNVIPIEGKRQADFYDYDEASGQMMLRSSAPLSTEITGIASDANRPTAGLLRESVQALFVTSTVTTGVVTDILAWRDDKLVNLTLNEETGLSDGTFRFNSSVSARDINSDNVLELPQPKALPDPSRVGETDNFWAVRWVQYDIDGNAWPVYNTYYNGEDGWYLILPESWEGKIALSRSDGSSTGERAVVFSYWEGNEGATPAPFLTIYKLTGPNRNARAQLGNRFILRASSDTIYAAEFRTGGWDCGLDQETLPEQFRLIQP